MRARRTRLSLTLTLLLFWATLSGAPGQTMGGEAGPGKAGTSETRVLCSVFPVQAIAAQLLMGTGIQNDLLLPADMGCPHHYALTPTDMKKVEEARVLLLNGLGFEPFIDRITQSASVITIEAAQGFEPLPVADGEPVNPHVFTTPKGLSHMTMRLAEGLSRILPAQEVTIKDNSRKFLAQVAVQGAQWEAAAQLASRPVLLAQDSLDYLAQDLHLQVLAHLESGDTPNLSAKEMLDLIALIHDKHPAAILTDSQQPSPTAETLGRETNLPIIGLDTLARGPNPLPDGYIVRVLADNLAALRAGLPPNIPAQAPSGH